MKRVLIGCGIGCGVLILAVIVAVVLFFVWLNREKPPVDTRFLLEDSTLSFVEAHLDSSDEGTLDLVHTLLVAAQKQTPRGASDNPITQMMQGARAGSMRREDLSKFLNVRFAIASGPGAGGTGETNVVVVSLGPRYNLIMGPASLLLRSMGTQERHDGRRLYVLPDKSSASIVQNTLLWANDPGALRAALDRMAAASSVPLSPEVAGLREDLPAEADAWGFARNEGSLLADWLPAPPDAAPGTTFWYSQVAIASFAVDILPQDRLTLELRLRTGSPEAASAILPEAIQWVRDQTLGRGFTGSVTGRSEAETAIVSGELEGLAAVLTKAMEDASRTGRTSSPPPVPGPESGAEREPPTPGEPSGAAASPP